MSTTISNNSLSAALVNVYNRNSSFATQAMSRVATAQRINSAKDGPSDWAISEKMRERINSLGQADKNVQNGNAMMKTAEGGIQNTVDLLKTIKERVLNASNASTSNADRALIQTEVNKLIEQVDYNAANVKYNGMNLLDGTMSNDPTAVSKATTQVSSIITSTNKANTDDLDNWTIHQGSSATEISIVWKNSGDASDTTTSIGSFAKTTTVDDFISAANTKLATAGANFKLQYFAKDAVVGTDADGADVVGSTTDNGIYAVSTKEGASGAFTFTKLDVNGTAKGTVTSINPGADANNGGGVVLQIGDEAGLSIAFGVDNMSFKSLSGQASLDVTTDSGRTTALSAINSAIDEALKQGTNVGTAEQRLGYVSDNLATQIENLEASDSAIRDADMAKEMTNYMKYMVLSQASQYMLAQAGQNGFSVLNLLQQ